MAGGDPACPHSKKAPGGRRLEEVLTVLSLHLSLRHRQSLSLPIHAGGPGGGTSAAGACCLPMNGAAGQCLGAGSAVGPCVTATQPGTSVSFSPLLKWEHSPAACLGPGGRESQSGPTPLSPTLSALPLPGWEAVRAPFWVSVLSCVVRAGCLHLPSHPRQCRRGATGQVHTG